MTTDTAHQVTSIDRPRRHTWPKEGEQGYVRTARCDDGNERVAKVCKTCAIARITVIPPHGYAWHEWMHPNSDKVFRCESTPPCQGVP